MKKIVILIALINFLSANWNLYPTYYNYLRKKGDSVYSFYFRANTPKKVVALTFDDGPTRYNKRLIKILKKHQTPATFFLIAKNLNSKNSLIYKNSLFTIGMHTYKHLHYDKLSKRAIERDLDKMIYRFNRFNLHTTLFRPAYGVINKKLLEALNKRELKGIIWSNDTNDWSKRKSYKRVINSLSSGDIILMHEHATTPKELENLILQIKKRGFKIVPLEELLEYKSTFPI